MTLRQLQNVHIIPMAATDRRLTPAQFRIYTYVYHRPLQSIDDIAHNLGYASRETVRQAIDRLVPTGWVEYYVPPGRRRGRLVLPWMPLDAERRLAHLLAQQRMSAPFLGEFTFFSMLDFCVNEYMYTDNAAPPWCVTAEDEVQLQIDRQYEESNVAIEFQGPQHFRVSNRYVRTAAELGRRRRYDGEKIRLCSLHKVEFIEILPEELEFPLLRRKLEGKLPLLPPRENGPVFRELMGMSRQLNRYLKKYQ